MHDMYAILTHRLLILEVLGVIGRDEQQFSRRRIYLVPPGYLINSSCWLRRLFVTDICLSFSIEFDTLDIHVECQLTTRHVTHGSRVCNVTFEG